MDTAEFQEKINTGYVFVPKGDHQVSGVLPPKQNVLVEAHPQAVIEGDPIFRTDRETRRVTVRGGIWRGQVWRHQGPEVLAHCFFYGMKITQSRIAFNLDTGLGLLFQDLWFTQCKTSWQLGGAGVINANRFVGCRVLRSKGIGLLIKGDQQKPRRANYVEGCWFETSRHPAIRAEAGTSHLSIQDCYFEDTGPAGGADIQLNPLGLDGVPPTVFVSGCYFNAPNQGQKARIRSHPQNKLFVERCTVVLRPGMRLVHGAQPIQRDNVIEQL